MKKESALEKLQQLVAQSVASILYVPTKTEIDYNIPSFPLQIHSNNLVIPKDKNSNPFKWAINSINKFKDSKVCVLIPGTRFDVYGTRHGKGAGWYDRFLSTLPSNWLRVGIIDKTKLSDTKLIRQEWDQSVDWVLVHDKNLWKAYKA